ALIALNTADRSRKRSAPALGVFLELDGWCVASGRDTDSASLVDVAECLFVVSHRWQAHATPSLVHEFRIRNRIEHEFAVCAGKDLCAIDLWLSLYHAHSVQEIGVIFGERFLSGHRLLH